jgi:hypothetical protein
MAIGTDLLAEWRPADPHDRADDGDAARVGDQAGDNAAGRRARWRYWLCRQ